MSGGRHEREIAAPPASRVKGFALHADLSSEMRAALLVQQVLRSPSVQSGVEHQAGRIAPARPVARPEVISLESVLIGQYLNSGRVKSWSLLALYTA
jgi:hypothetical protein